MEVPRWVAITVLAVIGLANAYYGVCSWEDGESNILDSAIVSYFVVAFSAAAGYA
jgi:hypothetical protein